MSDQLDTPVRRVLNESELVVEAIDSINAVEAADWDRLVGDYHPFIEHAFIAALERSGSTGPATGWGPLHLLVKDSAGSLVGAAPLYIKGDSYGEYIFDWAWASAAHRGGLEYYPKLTAAVPFTPATGPRLLVASDMDPVAVRAALAKAAVAVCEQTGASGVHWLFCTEAEQDALTEVGYAPRLSRQFHWENPGFGDFADYLDGLTRKRRKECRRERRIAGSHGLDIEVIAGTDLSEQQWDAIYQLYSRTVAINGQIQYLTEDFFHRIRDTFAHRVVSVMCSRGGVPVAGNINFTKGDHLYGRYWGAFERCEALHFEACYYTLIEWGIANGIQRFEAGAQGHHKLARGFLPSITRSAHVLMHPGLRASVERYLKMEAEHVVDERDYLQARSPYKADRSAARVDDEA